MLLLKCRKKNVSAWHIIKDFLAPAVLGKSFAHPRDIFPAMKRVRGHHMAKAAVEMGMWGLAAMAAGLPLGKFYPELADCMLLCATEMSRRADMDAIGVIAQQVSAFPVLAKDRIGHRVD